MISEYNKEFLEATVDLLRSNEKINELNSLLRDKTGIINFFKSSRDYKDFFDFISNYNEMKNLTDDLGDFQTPQHLTDKICGYFSNMKFFPEAILEPTCGQGNFIISAIKYLPSLKYVYCIETQPNYEWLFKLNILKEISSKKRDLIIEFHRDNVFTHKYSNNFLNFLTKKTKNFLILGNPPWITNSELSVLNSNNLPEKKNIKKIKGIDAITGSGNFDIAENIILKLIQKFSFKPGKIAMLCKTIVIKNIIRDMRQFDFNISNIQSLTIDTNKEFNINADAALFTADFGKIKENFCKVASFYNPKTILKSYGWYEKKFVSNIDIYKKYKDLDGKTLFEWRQGVKHDAADVMILITKSEGNYTNRFEEPVDIESDLLYPFLKGSDLRVYVIKNTPLRLILTQTALNEDTSYIEMKYPKLWKYLNLHSEKLDNRKSKIYKNKPRFSIFGVGDYSLKPYKIGIASFYKDPLFSLIVPIDEKPVIVDDTSYQLGFDDFNEAFFTWLILNLNQTKEFLSSIVFLDSKRPYTKKELMRINLTKLLEKITFEDLTTLYEDNLQQFLTYQFNQKDFLIYKKNLEDKSINLDKFLN